MIPIAAPAKTFQVRLTQPIVRSRLLPRSEAIPVADVLVAYGRSSSDSRSSSGTRPRITSAATSSAQTPMRTAVTPPSRKRSSPTNGLPKTAAWLTVVRTAWARSRMPPRVVSPMPETARPRRSFAPSRRRPRPPARARTCRAGERSHGVQRAAGERDNGRDAHQPARIGVVGRRARRNGGQQERHVDEPARERRRLRRVPAGRAGSRGARTGTALDRRGKAVGPDQGSRSAWDLRAFSRGVLCGPEVERAASALRSPRPRHRTGALRSPAPGRPRRRRPGSRPPPTGSRGRLLRPSRRRGTAPRDGVDRAEARVSRRPPAARPPDLSPVRHGPVRATRGDRSALQEPPPGRRSRRGGSPTRACGRTLRRAPPDRRRTPIRSWGIERLLPRLRITITSSPSPNADVNEAPSQREAS